MDYRSAIIALLIACTLFAGCTDPSYRQVAPSSREEHPNAPDPAIITETTGKVTTLSRPASRIITQNGDAAEFLIAFGAGDTIIGVSDSILDRPDLSRYLGTVPSIGDWQTPSIERITVLKPDVMVTYGSMIKNADQIQAANVTIVRIDSYRIPNLASDARAIGNLTGRRDRAEEYAQFMEHSLELVETRLNRTPAGQILNVYAEGYSDYSAHGSESGATQLLDLLHARNTGRKLPGLSQTVNPEWIIDQDPDVILKIASQEDLERESLDDIRTRIMSRPGFDRISAVRSGRVYVVNGDLISSPRAVAGVLYVAKALYPDQFRDIEPDSVLKDYADRFFPEAAGIPTIAPKHGGLEGRHG